MDTSPPKDSHGRPGRSLVLLGLVLPLLAVAAYAAQLSTYRMTAPWYLPVAATLGVLLVVASLWQARTVWRWLALVPVLLICAAAWMFLLGTRLPAYTGPVAVGEPFPAFATVRADGSPFTDRDLAGDVDNVLVFFRGRW
jgi:hypothetical protein